MMTTVEEIELHDALLQSMNVNYATKVADINVEFYKDGEERNRILLLLTFEGVVSISQVSDLERMQENAFAGNVNFWVPAKDGGTTYIYLTDGCIAIKAKKLRVEIQKE